MVSGIHSSLAAAAISLASAMPALAGIDEDLSACLTAERSSCDLVVARLRESCDMGTIPYCYLLGVLYESGRGVMKNFAEAAGYYAKACDEDNASACLSLGHLYGRGAGVNLDSDRANEFFGKACERGSQDGCDTLERSGHPAQASRETE